jgi:hypothetical protein
MAGDDRIARLQRELDTAPAPPRPNGNNGAGLAAAREIQFRHIADIVAERREPEWLLHKILERKVLAVLAGPRGTFKSFVALDWTMRVACDGHPCVILSGEGAGLDRRVEAWLSQHRESTDIAEIPILAIEQPLNLCSSVELGALEEAVEKCAHHPHLIVIDTLSKFSPGLDENDNGKVSAFLHGLTDMLRDTFDCTVLLVAHSGHGNQGRPRGASALMANPDAEYIVNRPAGGMLLTVSRERFKDSSSMPPLAYDAKVINLGRVDKYGEPVTSLALIEAEGNAIPLSRQNSKGHGKNQEAIIIALREWARSHPDVDIIASPEMLSLCKAHLVSSKRKPEVLNWLVNAGILTASIGGHRINRDVLW